jgi:hypothetical protein
VTKQKAKRKLLLGSSRDLLETALGEYAVSNYTERERGKFPGTVSAFLGTVVARGRGRKVPNPKIPKSPTSFIYIIFPTTTT